VRSKFATWIEFSSFSGVELLAFELLIRVSDLGSSVIEWYENESRNVSTLLHSWRRQNPRMRRANEIFTTTRQHVEFRGSDWQGTSHVGSIVARWKLFSSGVCLRKLVKQETRERETRKAFFFTSDELKQKATSRPSW
jgi:hypothetical protein